MRAYGYLLLTGLCFLWGCNGSQQGTKNAGKDPAQARDNYIVLLDVSDRIMFNNQQQIPKDIAVIQSIYSIFKTNLAKKDPSHQYYNLTDKLKLLAAPNWYYASVDLSAEQPAKKALLADQTENTLNTLLPGIYQQAVTSNKTNDDSGADIWKYFNNYISDDLDNDAQNTLFIITDGYMNVKKPEDRPVEKHRYPSPAPIIAALKYYPDWETMFKQGDYGLLPVKKKFPNLNVILLQLNPKEGWDNEYNLLIKIWSKWFTEMDIRNYHFIKNDTISLVNESLGKLMNQKIDRTTAMDQAVAMIKTDSGAAKRFDSTKGKAAASVMPPPVVTTEPQKKPIDTVKKTIVAAPVVIAKEKTSPPIVPVVTSPAPEKKKPAAAKRTNSAATRRKATKDDGILNDNGAANGFNTGIKKDTKKKNP